MKSLIVFSILILIEFIFGQNSSTNETEIESVTKTIVETVSENIEEKIQDIIQNTSNEVNDVNEETVPN